jgi:hypothetical protein
MRRTPQAARERYTGGAPKSSLARRVSALSLPQERRRINQRVASLWIAACQLGMRTPRVSGDLKLSHHRSGGGPAGPHVEAIARGRQPQPPDVSNRSSRSGGRRDRTTPGSRLAASASSGAPPMGPVAAPPSSPTNDARHWCASSKCGAQDCVAARGAHRSFDRGRPTCRHEGRPGVPQWPFGPGEPPRTAYPRCFRVVLSPMRTRIRTPDAVRKRSP